MSYLYGDASASTLEVNFIEFLRDATDFAVQVLTADRHIREGGERAVELRQGADAEVAHLESLGAVISRAVEDATIGEAESPTAQCAEAILRSSADQVRHESNRVQAKLVSELAQLDDQAGRERANCEQALGALLVRHNLPDWVADLSLEQQAGARYAARLHVKADLGLEVTLELEIAPSHLLAHVARVDKLVERLEVQTPEEGGWLRKEVKLRPQRLEKDYVTEIHVSADETTFKLRTNPDGTGAGFDVSVRAEAPRVHFRRAGEPDSAPLFEPNEADAARIVELQEKLVSACAELARTRRGLLDAKLDGKPLKEHPEPRVLAERLIESITPTLKEIAKRSLSPTELVLKRQLDNGRREEIFISRDEIRQKLSSLTDAQRVLFAPMGLAGPAPRVESAAPKSEPKAESAAPARVAPRASRPTPAPAPAPLPAMGGDASDPGDDEDTQVQLDAQIPGIAKPK